jgi:hypothetical protein
MGAKIMEKSLYRQFDIWKKIDDNVIVKFRCFEKLENNMFCVQSADYFYAPIDVVQLHNSDKQLIELFMEESPEKRSELYSTIDEAITHHIEDFIE